MKKSFYESPLCEYLELDPESTMMQTGSSFGETGRPGTDLDILEEITTD